MNKKKTENSEHKSLEEFDIHINESGEIKHGFDIDKVNEFLNQNTTDWRIQAEKGRKDVRFEEEE